MKPSTITSGTILFIASSLPLQAFADPVTLVCAGSDLTWKIPIDAEAQTAAGMHANFTSQTITWHDVLNGSEYVLDRVSGVLRIDGTREYVCTADRKF